jgi:uncharacterized protein YjbJ (UPF0337 family)
MRKPDACAGGTLRRNHFFEVRDADFQRGIGCWNTSDAGGVGFLTRWRYARRRNMDKDRIKGSAEQAKGKAKEVAGKVTGDSKLETEGQADQVKGKVQSTVGGLKDTLRGK